MGLRDLLKKKDRPIDSPPGSSSTRLNLSEFTFIRSDTQHDEVLHPPSGRSGDGTDPDGDQSPIRADGPRSGTSRLSIDVLCRGRSASASSSGPTTPVREKDLVGHRLSHRLHLSRSSASSDVVPQDLPEIITTAGDADDGAKQWEKRATMLAKKNETVRRSSQPPTPSRILSPNRLPPSARVVSSQAIDATIQEAIRLHEAGKLEKSTALFALLADPQGANNTLSQVLYGLALRHGWGCEADLSKAVTYLSAAAANAADIENMALSAGLKKGGAAKGELVLAIFELANCFRHGWGNQQDPFAAKLYYETAANLGDTDAMNEVAWCYLEGFGTKKDKFAAAKYYRLAEQNGNKTVGNTWIWKDKYNPDNKRK